MIEIYKTTRAFLFARSHGFIGRLDLALRKGKVLAANTQVPFKQRIGLPRSLSTDATLSLHFVIWWHSLR